MGKLSIEFCDYCKKVGPTEEVFLMTDRDRRSTEARHKSLHLCEEHLSDLKTCFEAFRKYSNLDLENLVLSTKTK